MLGRLLLLLGVTLPLAACSGEDLTLPILDGATEQLVPSARLPLELEVQPANNNLDVIRHEGRVYLAFRTGPSHFASPEVVLHVVSSTDEGTWVHETSFHRGTDLREPRFLSFEGRLFLYFAVLGQSAIDFEPQGMMVSERAASGAWSEPEPFYEPGFIVWRTKVIDGTAYMLAYKGGENIYDNDREPTDVHFLTTRDGRTFAPVVEGRARIQGGGASETDFVLQDDGSLIAVLRNEAGDELGWGSKICRAEPGALADWRCVADPRKYDSPLLFRHGPGIFLIGRRNISENAGLYDLMRRDEDAKQQTLYYQLDYSGHPKRCAVWRVDPDRLSVHHLFDLPSRGDTCFPGILPLGDGRYAIYNYSSPIDGEELTWLEGQLGPTNIYRSVLSF